MAIKVLVMGGVPASGKTTVMKKIMELTDDWKLIKPEKLLDAMFSKKLNAVVLGKYLDDDNAFQGTDRLSMAVQPDAEKFFRGVVERGQDINILFEGDRLFNSKTMDLLSDLFSDRDFRIVIVQADAHIVEQRHIDRKDTQDEKFKRGRETKVGNIASNLALMDYIDMMQNNNFADQQKIVDHIVKHFNWSE